MNAFANKTMQTELAATLSVRPKEMTLTLEADRAKYGWLSN